MMKNGRPISEVTMPMGNTAPGTINLLVREARVTKMIPQAMVTPMVKR